MSKILISKICHQVLEGTEGIKVERKVEHKGIKVERKVEHK